jgi:hypothetical protein
MTKVVSVDYQIAKLKELSLLDTRLDSESKIDEILNSVIECYEEFRHKYKGNEVYTSSKLKSNATKGVVDQWSSMVYGSSSCSKSKGKKKSEFMTIGNPFAKGINKAHKKSKGKPKGVCYYYNKDGHWLRNFSKYLAFKRVG